MKDIIGTQCSGIGVIFMSDGDSFVFRCDDYESAERTFENQFYTDKKGEIIK